jgi:2-succinyl-6-hydroxy-2,4-cyclohexadiene-1-carboxylate synthase
MPVLVVAGARDEKFTALGRRMVDAIGSSATFASVSDAGHAAHLEQPAAFVTLVERWLARDFGNWCG